MENNKKKDKKITFGASETFGHQPALGAFPVTQNFVVTNEGCGLICTVRAGFAYIQENGTLCSLADVETDDKILKSGEELEIKVDHKILETACSSLDGSTRLYLCVVDSDGNVYSKRHFTVKALHDFSLACDECLVFNAPVRQTLLNRNLSKGEVNGYIWIWG